MLYFQPILMCDVEESGDCLANQTIVSKKIFTKRELAEEYIPVFVELLKENNGIVAIKETIKTRIVELESIEIIN